MKIDLQGFVEGATHAFIGMQQGQMKEQLLAQQRQQQEYAQLLQAAQVRQQQQGQEQQNIFHALQYADPNAQASLLGQAFNQPDPYADVAKSQFVQSRPDLARLYGSQQTPAGVQTQPQQPLGPRQFRGPGGVVVGVKGVTKEQMTALQKQLADAAKGLEDYAPAATDPTERVKITGLLQSIRGLDMSTPEGYAEGRRLASEAGLYASYGRQAAQNADARKLKEKADEDAAVGKEIRAHLAEQNPLAITPAGVRGLYANWKGKDYSYLIKDVPDEQLKLGDAKLWDRRGQITGQLASQVNVDAKTQNVLLSELKMINKRLGIEEEPVPPSIQKRPPTPEEAAAERRRAAEELRNVEDEKRRAAEEARKAERFPVEMEKLRADRDRLQKAAEAKSGKFDDVQKAKLSSAEEGLARARADRKNGGVSATRVDLSSPRPANPILAARWDLAKREVEAEMKLYHTQEGLGLKPAMPNLSMWFHKKPVAPAPKGKEPSWLDRIWQGAKERLTGDQPTEAAPRGKPLKDWSDYEIRQEHARQLKLRQQQPRR